MITVKDLFELLSDYEPTDIVVLAKDNEWNGFSPLDQTSHQLYVPRTSYNGDVHIRDKVITDAMREMGYTESDICQDNDAQKCVVLWPTN